MSDAVLPIPDGDPRVVYSVVGSTTGPFPVSFPLPTDWQGSLRVKVGSIELAAGQFLFSPDTAVAGGYPSGNVTLTSAVAATTVEIWRDVPVSRAADYANGPLDFAALNSELARLTMQLQDQRLASQLAGADTFGSGTLVTANGSTNARSLADRFAQEFHVKDYGATGDGTTNDATAINAAIAAAAAVGGGRVIFGPDTYAHSATLAITTSNVILVGQGGEHSHDVGSSTPATKLKWTGANGGVQVSISATSGAGNQRLHGSAMRGIMLDGNSGLAGYGLQIRSLRFAHFSDIFALEHTVASYDISTVSELGESEDTQDCVFERLASRHSSGSSPNGDGFLLDGALDAGNTSLNTFHTCSARVVDGVAYHLKNADFNLFMRCRAQVTGTGDGIVFEGSDVEEDQARNNEFYNFSGGSSTPIVAKGSPTYDFPSKENRVLVIDQGNNTEIPTIETGATLFYSFGDSAVFAAEVVRPGGRLTLTSATPVTTSDVTAATSVYYALAEHDKISIYFGGNSRLWRQYTFAELTLALDSDSGHTGYHQSGKNFDLFVINDAGTLRLGTGPAWSSDTARGTGAGTTELARKNGVWTNAVTITIRFGSGPDDTVSIATNKATYVGTMRASANGQTEDSAAKRFVWNLYNRRVRLMKVVEGTDTWTYSTASYRQANASAANQLAYVVGMNEDAVEAEVSAMVENDTATARVAKVGIGVDSATVQGATTYDTIEVTQVTQSLGARFIGYPGLGYHFLAWLERGDGNDVQTWSGDEGGAAQTGIFGRVLG